MQTKQAILESFMKILKPHGPITSRAMFGGYGIYYHGVIFASVIEDELYFRIDEETKADYEIYKSKPFVYEGARKPVIMPYRTLPDEVLHNPKLLKKYILAAYEASLRSKLKKKKRKVRASTRAEADLD